MTFQIGSLRVSISFLFCIVLCLIVLFDDGVILSAFLAVCAHESAHLLAMLWCGEAVESVCLEPFGILIKKETGVRSFWENVAIAAAGCAMNLFLFAGFFCVGFYLKNEKLIYFAAVNAALFLVNLLPAEGLDGAALLRLLFVRLFPRKNGERIGKTASVITCVFLLIIGVILYFKVRQNPSLCLFSLFLLLQSFAKPLQKD